MNEKDQAGAGAQNESPPQSHQEDAPSNSTNEANENDASSKKRAHEADTEPPRSRLRMADRMVKVLLTDHEAGALIGKGGSFVSKLQERTGARVKISNNNMFFPGTQYRIIMVEADDEPMKEVLTELVHICFADPKVSDSGEGQLVLALPSVAAPMLIGKKGSTVAELNKSSGASVRLGRREDEVAGTNERITKIVGRRDNVVSAVLSVVDLMFREDNLRYSVYENRTTNYDAHLGGSRRYDQRDRGESSFRDYRDSRDYRDGYSGRGGDSYDYSRRENVGRAPPRSDSRAYDSMESRGDRSYRGGRESRDIGESRRSRSPERDGDRDSREVVPLVESKAHRTLVSVPDELVGAMLGRQGENVNEIQARTNTRITVSQRNEFVSGTRDRIVTISGNPDDCDEARKMLADRILPPEGKA